MTGTRYAIKWVAEWSHLNILFGRNRNAKSALQVSIPLFLLICYSTFLQYHFTSHFPQIQLLL